jgi:hypothetical protein
MRIELPVPDRSSDIDGPVASAVDVGTAPAFERLIGADLITEIVQLPVQRSQLITEFVFKPLALEIAFVAGDPFDGGSSPRAARDDLIVA